MKTKAFIAIILAALMLLCGCGVTEQPPMAAPTAEPTAVPNPTQQAAHHEHEGYLIAQPLSHEYAADPDSIVTESGGADMDKYHELREAWNAQMNARREAAEAAPDMKEFTSSLLDELIKQAGGGNIVFSPANIYMALAMLAECTDGDTRAEVLAALGAEDIEELRASVAAFLSAEPIDDEVTKCAIANSLWLNDIFGFNTETLERIAEVYEGSSYWGDPMDPGFSQALRDWLNAATGDLLKDSVEGVELPPETVFAIASAIYFKAAWEKEYIKNATDRMAFHAPAGDIEADFMHKTATGNYYKGEGFSAYRETLKNGAGSMWFLLPDEGVSVEEMMSGKGMEFLYSDKTALEHANARVHVSMPKLDVSSEIQLLDALQGIGLSACFDPSRSDFTPILSDTDELFMSDALHAARVKTDEEGVEAAAFTLLMFGNGMIMPEEEVYFTLDRPFAFVITGQSNAPLLMGIVNVPTD